MGTTAKYAFPWPAGPDLISQGDEAIRSLAEALDTTVATDSQGTFASRPVFGKAGRYYFATDTGVLYRDTGAAWNPVPAASPTYVTSLPGSPVDGQEIYYAADATNGVIWHLRYRTAASGSYKWEFVGGSPTTAVIATEETINSATYVALTTAGPSLTVPLAGDYWVTAQAHGWADNGTSGGVASMSYDIGATAAVDLHANMMGSGAFSSFESGSQKSLLTAVAATTVLLAKYRHFASPSARFKDRRLALLPVRVG